MVAQQQTYKEIMSKIRTKEPLPKWYKSVASSGLVMLLLGLYLGSITFMVWLSYDVYEKTRLCKYETCGIDAFTFGIPYEYAVMAIVFGSLVYFFYRTTDWPYVKERMYIVVSLVILGAILTSGLVFWLKSANDPIAGSVYDLKESVKNILPWRHSLVDTSKLKPIVGVVEHSSDTKLSLILPLKQRVVLFYQDTYPETYKPANGSRVVVSIKLYNNALYVDAIEVL